MQDNFMKVFSSQDVEFTVNGSRYSEPFKLLEELYIVRHDKSLTSKEKNMRVQNIMKEYMEWLGLENIKSSIALNLSNQGNVYKSRESNLSQFNFFVILGLDYLNNIGDMEAVPISIDINGSGDLTINGLDGDLINNENIYIYSDKKVTDNNN